ncbi:MAG TPA: hypothetical protein VF988_17645 [Verrucomicrobiae bacterium]
MLVSANPPGSPPKKTSNWKICEKPGFPITFPTPDGWSVSIFNPKIPSYASSGRGRRGLIEPFKKIIRSLAGEQAQKGDLGLQLRRSCRQLYWKRSCPEKIKPRRSWRLAEAGKKITNLVF